MFNKIIQELIDSGLTETEIAMKVGASQPTINRIRNGKQVPYWKLGNSLVELHRELVKLAA